jgi:transcriptional regulator of arginine metabolism
MNKVNRQIAIKQIVSEQAIGSQEELCTALHNSGFEITQASLSRDLRELGIVRINTPGGLRYVLNPLNEERRLQSFIGYEVEQISANESLVVIKTLPGRAQGVAEIIDSLHNELILGTIAGDNTIFVTPTSVGKMDELVKLLRHLTTEDKKVA